MRARSIWSRILVAACGAGAITAVAEWFMVCSSLQSASAIACIKILLFLLALHFAIAIVLGGLLGAIASGLLRATAMGRWLGVSLDPAFAPAVSYIIAGAVSLVLFGLALRPVARYAFTHFHHPWLLASWIAALATVLGVVAVVGFFGVAALLTRFAPGGKRFEFPPRPASYRLLTILVALSVGAVALAGYCHALVHRPRMSPPIRALNVALFGSVLWCGAAVATIWCLDRAFIRLRFTRIGHFLSTSVGALAIGSLWIALGAVPVALWQWATLRQLDYRPVIAAAVFGAAFVLLLANQRNSKLKVRWLLLTAPVAVAAIVGLGENSFVRKHVVAQTGLGGPLIRGLQLLSDWDHDGYAAILGGGDCKPFNKKVHPFAYDVPGDAIDQNCNGHLADSAPPAVWQAAVVPAAVPDRPNVVLITIDALRADHMTCYGYGRNTTPKLDELAQTSVRFSQAWAHAPSTRYSVPAILTGRYPSTIAVGRAWWPPNVLPENRLLAEMFHERGYQTAAFLSYYYFNRAWGLDQGFDIYDTHLETLHSMGGDPARTHGTSARELADANIEFLRAPHDRPFFLWTHFYDTHFDFETHPDMAESNFGSSEIDRYDGEIRFTDHHVGRVLEALRTSGLWENTVVIVTSDHGDGFGEHGLPPTQRHGYHLYANETKVPLIIRIPGVPAAVADTLASHVDIAPTLINLLRPTAPVEPQLLGQSLIPWLKSGLAPTDRAIYQEVWYEGPTYRKALVTSKFHLINNEIPDGSFEFFDRLADPQEERDLDGQRSEQNTIRNQLAIVVDQLAPLVPSYNRP